LFDKLLRQIEELKNIKSVSVPIEADKKVILIKNAPMKNVNFNLKILKRIWNR
jgi:hypothetical protein